MDEIFKKIEYISKKSEINENVTDFQKENLTFTPKLN